MTPVPRSVLLVVAVLLGGVAVFGLVSGVMTAMGRGGPPSAATALPTSETVQQAKPLETILPPPPVPEKPPEPKPEEKDEDDAADAAPAAPMIQPPPPPIMPAPSVVPAAPPPAENDSGPALY